MNKWLYAAAYKHFQGCYNAWVLFKANLRINNNYQQLYLIGG